jgi:iron complex transport system substrate-binding protein
MKSRIGRVTSRIATTDYRPRVFFQIGISPIVSVGSDTFIHEIIVLAGGKNLAAGRIPYPRFSQEQVLGLSPEVFILTSMARTGAFEKAKAKWERWPQLDAVRSGRIHLVDSNLFDRPSPRLVEALEVMARLIHPELFEAAK